MAERYQERPYLAADYDRGDPHGAGRGESDPLAELARLIGQTDPIGSAAKPAPHPLQSRANIRPQYDPPEQYDLPEEVDSAPPSPPTWMQRARHEPAPPPPPPQDYDDEPEYQPAPVHPLHRYAAQQPQAPAQDYDEQPQYADAEPQQDPSRYDDALYGRIESGEQDYQRDPAYPDDPYAYQNGYDEEPAPKKRSSGLMTVAAVLALAVVGTGAAFAYRTYVGSPRSGEPPIIRADNSPTKVVPAQSDGGASKTPDRMPPGDGGEKLVSREEAPVDVNSRSGAPRVVFPQLNQNGSPPHGCERISHRRGAGDGRERHAAEQRAAQDQDARGEGRRGRERRHPRRRYGPSATTGTGDAVRCGPGRRSSRPAVLPRARATLPRPMPAPIRRYHWRRRAANRPIPRRPAWRRPIRPRRRRRPTAAAIWFRSPRRRTRPMRRPPSGRCRANSRTCWAPSRQ